MKRFVKFGKESCTNTQFHYSVPNPSIALIFVYIFQAKNVGVGGYLLGVGVNPIGTTHRHGYGADHVLSYKIVLADGSIALVDNDFTKIIEKDGKKVDEVYAHTEVSYHTGSFAENSFQICV